MVSTFLSIYRSTTPVEESIAPVNKSNTEQNKARENDKTIFTYFPFTFRTVFLPSSVHWILRFKFLLEPTYQLVRGVYSESLQWIEQVNSDLYFAIWVYLFLDFCLKAFVFLMWSSSFRITGICNHLKLRLDTTILQNSQMWWINFFLYDIFSFSILHNGKKWCNYRFASH